MRHAILPSNDSLPASEKGRTQEGGGIERRKGGRGGKAWVAKDGAGEGGGSVADPALIRIPEVLKTDNTPQYTLASSLLEPRPKIVFMSPGLGEWGREAFANITKDLYRRRVLVDPKGGKAPTPGTVSAVHRSL